MPVFPNARRSWPLLAAALLLMSSAACGPRPSSGGGAVFGAGPIVVAKSTAATAGLEQKMHARLNRDRKNQGLPPLALHAKLSDIARAHSKDMNERNFFSHDSPRTGSLEDRLDRASQLFAAGRENIGEGADVDGTQDALLKSAGHRANIMARDVTHVGIGIIRVGSGASERLLVTQVFAKPLEPADPAAARAVVARRVAEARRAAGLRALPAHPLLERLAKKHVADVADNLDPSAARKIGESVTGELAGSGLTGVAVGSSVFIAAELYEPRGAVTRREARALGIATAKARDERGRPAVKVLLLVGQ
jgi:uncharacterized protein YkwD